MHARAQDPKFELYNDSKTRKSIEQQGGQSVIFPRIADRVAGALYSDRLSIAKACSTLRIGDRAELKRWRKLAHTMMQGVIGD